MSDRLIKAISNPYKAIQYLGNKLTITSGAEYFSSYLRDSGIASSQATSFVLIDALYDLPKYVTNHALIGWYLSLLTSSQPAFLIRNRYDRELYSLGQSFSGNVFYMHPSLSVRPRVSALKRARSTYNELNSPEDVLEIMDHGIEVGDLIYNSYLRQTGEGTISLPSEKLFRVIYNQFIYDNYYLNIFERNEITAVVLAHPHYSLSGGLARVAIQQDTEVYLSSGFPDVHVKKCGEITDVKSNMKRPYDDLFEYVRRSHKQAAIERGYEKLSARVNGIGDYSNAYASEKSELDENELMKQYNLRED
ncbi:MAG: hypothetical protein ABEI86_10365, partial [Halobacteriaceae archaeon]